MPKPIKDLWCFHQQLFSWLTYSQNCTEKALKPNTRFSDESALRESMERFALGKKYNNTKTHLGIIDKTFISYVTAPFENKKAILEKLSNLIFKMLQQFDNLLVDAPPNQADEAFTEQKTTRTPHISKSELMLRQTASSFATNLAETLIKSLASHESTDRKLKHLTINYLAPIATFLIEFGMLAITKSATHKSLMNEAIIALTPRIFETMCFQLLGRVVPSCLPTLRQYHGYLGLYLIGHSIHNDWKTGLPRLCAGFFAGHLGQLCAYGIIKTANKHGLELGNPNTETETAQNSNPSNAEQITNHALGMIGQWFKRLEAKATQIDNTITKWVKNSWAAAPLYNLILTTNEAPQTEPSTPVAIV